MQVSRLAVIHIAPELLLRLTPTVLYAYSRHLGVALHTHPEDMATRFYTFLQRRLLVREVPAIGEHMREGEGGVLVAVLFVDLPAVHLALRSWPVPTALPRDLPLSLRLADVAFLHNRLT
eukprot:6753735-Prymnesium_polylepis.2